MFPGAAIRDGVGAFDSNLNVASFSNRGVPIDVVAPGVGILSTTPVAGSKYANNYASISGTSMATPHVAALAGLLAMASPGVSSDEVTRTIERSADLPQDGWSPDFGYGRIDAERAITGANWRNATVGGVSGQVQDQAGIGLPGATVTLNFIAVVSGEGGLFRFTGVAPGDYTMTVATGLTTLDVPVTITAGADTPTHFRVGVLYGILRGTIPDPGMVVSAWQDGTQRAVAISNSVGQFRLFVDV